MWTSERYTVSTPTSAPKSEELKTFAKFSEALAFYRQSKTTRTAKSWWSYPERQDSVKLSAGSTGADFLAESNLEAGQDNVSFLTLARLISALPVEQRLQLLDMLRNSLEPIQTEAAAAEA
jgi:hypothetical protein